MELFLNWVGWLFGGVVLAGTTIRLILSLRRSSRKKILSDAFGPIADSSAIQSSITTGFTPSSTNPEVLERFGEGTPPVGTSGLIVDNEEALKTTHQSHYRIL